MSIRFWLTVGIWPLALFGFCVAAGAADGNRDCQDAGSNADIRRCEAQRAQQAALALAQTVQDAVAQVEADIAHQPGLADNNRARLRLFEQEQRAWEQYRDAYCGQYEAWQGGTAAIGDRFRCLDDWNRTRAAGLERRFLQ